jgi:hypothetical protein
VAVARISGPCFRKWNAVTQGSHRNPQLKNSESCRAGFTTFEPNSNSPTLATCFGRFLSRQGFESCDSLKDGFVILDFFAESEQCLLLFSQIPPSLVAICLIPASAGEDDVRELPKNVIPVSEPFLTSTMNSGLEEAYRLC